MNFERAALDVLLLWILTAPHEFAHAWVATRLGDDTPRRDGRVTLNPLAHVDWMGTAILPAVTSLLGGGFIGWGKPVYTEIRNLRGGLNGLVLVALAGPFANILLSLVFGAAALIAVAALPSTAGFFARGVYMSLYLAIFNLLPVPPLDGSKLLLAARVPWVIYNELARMGFILLLVVMSYSSLGHWIHDWSMTGAAGVFGLFGLHRAGS